MRAAGARRGPRQTDARGRRARRQGRLAVFLVVMTVLPCGAADTQPELIQVQGESFAPGPKPDRVAAASQAERYVVSQVLESLVGAKNLPFVRSLLEEASHYVPAADVVKEERHPDGVVVHLEAFVDRAALARDASARVLPCLIDRPTVVTFFKTKREPEESPTAAPASAVGAAEWALVEAFREGGLIALDPEEVRAHYDASALDQRSQGDASGGDATEAGRFAREAGRFARENLADVAVVGELRTSAMAISPGSNILRVRATLSARVVRSYDAKVFEARQVEAVVNGLDAEVGALQAVRDAAAKIKESLLVAAILAVASGEPPADAVITVTGLGAPSDWAEVLVRAKDILDADQIEDLRFSPGTAYLRVIAPDALSDFVGALTARSFSHFRLEARSAVGREVTVAAIPE